jgi:hypothetical protein
VADGLLIGAKRPDYRGRNGWNCIAVRLGCPGAVRLNAKRGRGIEDNKLYLFILHYLSMILFNLFFAVMCHSAIAAKSRSVRNPITHLSKTTYSFADQWTSRLAPIETYTFAGPAHPGILKDFL